MSSARRLPWKPVPQIPFAHDFSITPNYYVFYSHPVTIDVWNAISFMQGYVPLADTLAVDSSRDADVHMFPRKADVQCSFNTAKLPPDFSFHHVNAYEREDNGNILVDMLLYHNFSFQKLREAPPGDPETYRTEGTSARYYRVELDPSDGSVLQRQKLINRTMEQPAIHPAFTGWQHRHVFACAATVDSGIKTSPLQKLIKLDTADPEASVMYQPTELSFMQEPIVIAKSQQENGGSSKASYDDCVWVVCVVIYGETYTAALHVYDGEDISKGPVCILQSDHSVPMRIHGTSIAPSATPPKQPTTVDAIRGV